MIALLVGLIVGFLMCIPIGPINVWVINTHLKTNSLRALSIALGGSVMDIFYFLVILSGLSFLEFGENTIFYLKLAGIILIFILGVREIMVKNVSLEKSDKKETPTTLMASFFLGVIIYTSNPTLVITMTGLGAFIKSLELFEFSKLNIVLVSLGLGVGSFSWFVFLIKVVDRYEEIIRKKYLRIFSNISGGLMVGLSLFMGTKLIG